MLCGWLSPNGEFYPCSSYGHVSLAEKLVEERYKAQKMEDQLQIPKDDLLLSDKWIKLFQDGLVAGNFSSCPFHGQQWITDEQVMWINGKIHELSFRQARCYSMYLNMESTNDS